MTLAEMEQEAKNIIQDSSFDASIIGYINEAFLQASGRINIPDLKRIASPSTVTEQMYTQLYDIDGGFSGRLTKLMNSDILRFNTLEDMLTYIQERQRVLTETGSVEMVALEGRTLWYFPIPTTEETLTCILHNNPTVLEFADDMPVEFPEICHRNIGVHGAAFLAYDIIEDGIDGDKVNTNHHFAMFEKGITQLQEWIGRHRVHCITSTSMDTTIATNDWNSTFVRWNNNGR